MNVKQKLKRILSKTVLYSWTLSYVSVFFIPFITSFLIYSQGNNALIEQINASYMQSLTKAATRTDDFLLKLNYIASSVNSSKELSEFLLSAEQYNGVPNYSYIAFSNLLKKQKNTLPSEIETVYFCVKDCGYIVSSNGIVKQDDFFDMYYGEDKPDIKELLSKFSYASYNVNDENIDFVYSFPLKETSVNPDGFFVIKLNNNSFLNLIAESADTSESNLYVIDKFDNVILNSQSFDKEIGSYDSYFADSTKKDGKIITVTAKSKYNSWKYVAEIPVKAITARMKYARILLWCLSCFSVLLGAFIIFYFMKKNYSELMSVVNVATSVLPGENNAQMNEYDIISNALSDYRKNIQISANVKYKRYKNERDKVLFKLIRDDFSEGILNELQKYNVELDSNEFLLLYIIPNEYEDIESEYNAEYDEKISAGESISAFVLSNIFEELLAEYSLVYSVYDSDSLLVFININKSNSNLYREKLVETLRFADDFVKLNFGFGFDAFVSSKYYGIQNTHEAYMQINRVKQYCASYKLSGVVFCDDILETTYIKNCKRSISHIFEFVRRGNIESAKKLFEAVFDRFRENASIYDIQIFAFSVCYAVIDIITETNSGEAPPNITELFDDINDITSSSTHAAGLREKLLNLIIKTADTIGVDSRNTKEKTDDDFIFEVKKYIDENYKNPDLYIKSIGDRFDKTPYYISNCFKSHEKISILNYISMLRIEEAKKMIKNTNKTFAEIAELVGFNNFRNFNRTFKKIEGITPGQFRKLSQEQ